MIYENYAEIQDACAISTHVNVEYPILRGIAEYIDERAKFVHLVIQGSRKFASDWQPPDYYCVVVSVLEREFCVCRIIIDDGRAILAIYNSIDGTEYFELSDPMCFEQLTESVIKHCETRAYITVRKCQPKTN